MALALLTRLPKSLKIALNQVSENDSLDLGKYLVKIDNITSEGASSHVLHKEEEKPQFTLNVDEKQSSKQKSDELAIHLQPPTVKYNYNKIPREEGISLSVLYTHQKQKKVKTWQDGYLYYFSEKGKAILYSSDMSYLDSLLWKSIQYFKDIGEMESDKYLIQYASNDPPVQTTRVSASLKSLGVKRERTGNIRAFSDVAIPDKTKVPKGKTTMIVLYTHQKTKKNKTWQDGQLVVTNKQASLLDSNKDCIETFVLDLNHLNASGEWESQKHLIQLENSHDDEIIQPKQEDFVAASTLIHAKLKPSSSSMATKSDINMCKETNEHTTAVSRSNDEILGLLG